MVSRKKVLKRLPFREADPELVKDVMSVMIAEKHLTEFGEVLVLSVTNCSYRPSERSVWDEKQHKYVPYFRWDYCRFFAMEDTYLTLLHTTDGEKWVATSPRWLGIERAYTDETSKHVMQETFRSWHCSAKPLRIHGSDQQGAQNKEVC